MQLRFSKYFTFRESNSSNSRHCMIPMLSALSAFYTVYVTGTAVTPKDPHQCTCIQSSELPLENITKLYVFNFPHMERL